MQVFEADCPRQHHSRVESHPKVRIIPLEFYSLFVVRVPVIQAENLIQDGEAGICQGDKNVRVRMVAGQPDEGYKSEQVIRPRVLH